MLSRCMFCGSSGGPFGEIDWLFRIRMCVTCQTGPASAQPATALRQCPDTPGTESAQPRLKPPAATQPARLLLTV
jgi:hypothetical protein